MKKIDPRHKKRQNAVKALFAWGFHQDNPLTPMTEEVIKKIDQIDQIIAECAPKWPLEKINRIDLAILRLAVYELYFDPKIPDKVAIDEAVELAKEFGSENSPSFVNGVLGTAYKLKVENKKSKTRTTKSEK